MLPGGDYPLDEEENEENYESHTVIGTDLR